MMVLVSDVATKWFCGQHCEVLGTCWCLWRWQQHANQIQLQIPQMAGLGRFPLCTCSICCGITEAEHKLLWYHVMVVLGGRNAAQSAEQLRGMPSSSSTPSLCFTTRLSPGQHRQSVGWMQPSFDLVQLSICFFFFFSLYYCIFQKTKITSLCNPHAEGTSTSWGRQHCSAAPKEETTVDTCLWG